MWILLILIAGLALRLLCSRGDLWLDEIWSIRLAEKINSAFEILTSIHHDNNHHLNTLVDYFLDDPKELWLYRLGPVIAGSLAVFVASRCARTPREGRFAAILFAFSFLLVFYSSEARGYAYLMLFSLLAYRTFSLDIEWVQRAVLFAVVCILGFLSHLSFLYVYCGLVAAGLVCAWQNRTWLENRFWMTLPAGIFLLVLWLLDLRYMHIGGDQPSEIDRVVFDTAKLLILPQGGYWTGLASLVTLMASGAWILWREHNRREQAFFFVSILLCPAVVLMLRTQSYLSPRYFLVPAIFLLLLASRTVCLLPRRLAFVIASSFVAINVWTLSQQGRTQRGAYGNAVALICAYDPTARVGSDHDFRNGLVIEYYAERMPACKGLQYAPMTEWNSSIPGWLVLHSLERDKPAPGEISPQGLGTYKLAGFFPSGEFSGWNWAVYRRERIGPREVDL